MKKFLAIILLAVLAGACGLINKQNLGLNRSTPQSVADKKEELVIPPNYNLRPEEPAVRQKITDNQGL